ncbi:unnamed protein product [Dicrocoelium dendriticum]|nr:unnamed protein product [Dicrocoelium dendriticum]
MQRRLDLESIQPDADSRLQEMMAYVQRCLNCHVELATESDKSSRRSFRAAILLRAIEIRDRWLSVQNEITEAVSQLSAAVDAWQSFESVRDQWEHLILRLEHWFKTKSTSSVNTKNELMELVESMRVVLEALNVKDTHTELPLVTSEETSTVELAWEISQKLFEIEACFKLLTQLPEAENDNSRGENGENMNALTITKTQLLESKARVSHLKKQAKELIFLWSARNDAFDVWCCTMHELEHSLLSLEQRTDEIQIQLNASDMDAKQSTQTIDDVLASLESISADRNKLTQQLADVRSKSSQLVIFLGDVGRQEVHEKLSQCQHSWEALRSPLDLLRTKLSRHQSAWSRLLTHLEAFDKWIMASETELDRMIRTTPWPVELRASIDLNDVDAQLLEAVTPRRMDGHRIGMSLVFELNERLSETYSFGERVHLFTETIDEESTQLDRTRLALDDLSGHLTCDPNGATRVHFDRVSERFFNLRASAIALSDSTKRYCTILQQFSHTYSECWKQLLHFQNEFDRVVLAPENSSIKDRQTQLCGTQVDALHNLEEQLGSVEILERLTKGLTRTDGTQNAFLEHLENLTTQASAVDSFELVEAEMGHPKRTCHWAVEILLHGTLQLAKANSNRLKQYLDENTLLEIVDRLYDELSQTLRDAEDDLDSAVTLQETYESMPLDQPLLWIETTINRCEEREAILVNRVIPSDVKRMKQLQELELFGSRLAQGTGRAYLDVNQRIMSIKVKHNLLVSRTRTLQSQLTQELVAWRKFHVNLQKWGDWLSSEEVAADNILSGRAPRFIDEDYPQTCYTNIVLCMDELERLEGNLLSNGKIIREEMEVTVQNLMLNIVPHSGNQAIRSKALFFQSPQVKTLSAVMARQYHRWDAHRRRLQVIRAELCDELMSQTKLNTALEQSDRWIRSMSLQVNVISQDMLSHLSELFSRIKDPCVGISEEIALMELNSWFSPKIHTLETFLDEVQQYSQADMQHIDTLVSSHLATEESVHTRLKRLVTRSCDMDTAELPTSALEHLNKLRANLSEVESRLSTLLSDSQSLYNLSVNFVRLSHQLYQVIAESHQQAVQLVSEMDYATRTRTQEPEDNQVNENVIKKLQATLTKLVELKNESLRASDELLTALKEAANTLIIKANHIQDAPGVDSPTSLVNPLGRCIERLGTYFGDLLTQLYSWVSDWSRFSETFDEVAAWLSSSESSVVETMRDELIGTPSGAIEFNHINDVQSIRDRVTTYASTSDHFHTSLLSRQSDVQELVVQARALVEKKLSSLAHPTPKAPPTMHTISSGLNVSFSGALAVSRATQFAQRYHALLSLCDRWSQLNQTALQTVEQTLSTFASYVHWAEDMKTELSTLENQMVHLNSPQSEEFVHVVKSRHAHPLWSRVIELTNKSEVGRNLVQGVSDWANRMVSELTLQERQRIIELRTLEPLVSRISRAAVVRESGDSSPLGRPVEVTTYAYAEHAALARRLIEVRSQVEQVLSEITQQNIAQQNVDSWLNATEAQLLTICQHAFPEVDASSMSDSFAELWKALSFLGRQSAVAIDALIELRSNLMGYETKINRMDDSREANHSVLRDRSTRLVERIDICREDLENRFRIVRLFQQSVRACTEWLQGVEHQLGCSDVLKNAVAIDTLLDSSDEAFQSRELEHMEIVLLTRQLISLSDAEQCLSTANRLGASIEDRGRQLITRVTEVGQQLVTNLRSVEAGAYSDQPAPNVVSRNHLSTLVQSCVEVLQREFASVNELQYNTMTKFDGLVRLWRECQDRMDRLSSFIGNMHNTAFAVSHQRVTCASEKSQVVLSFEKFLQDCLDRKQELDVCMKIALEVKELAPDCQIPEQLGRLGDRYKNVMQSVESTLNRLRQAAEMHGRYDQTLAEARNWLGTITVKLPWCTTDSAVPNSQAEVEQNLTTHRLVAEELSQRANTTLDSLCQLADQVMRTSDTEVQSTIAGEVGAFRQTVHQTTLQVTQSQHVLEAQLDRLNRWSTAHAEATQAMHSLSQSGNRQEDKAILTSTRLISLKQAETAELEQMQYTVDNVKAPLVRLRQAAADLSAIQPQADHIGLVEAMERKLTKVEKELEVCVSKTRAACQQLTEFGTQISKVESGILSLSLKLMAVHATEPDGPRGVIRLGMVLTELGKQLEFYQVQTLPQLMTQAARCMVSVVYEQHADAAMQALTLAPGGGEACSAEQGNSTHNGTATDNVGPSQEDGPLGLNPFQMEITQMKASCEDIGDMLNQITAHLFEQQRRWASLVSVIFRVAEYLQNELPAWWAKLPSLPDLGNSSHSRLEPITDELSGLSTLTSSEASDQLASSTSPERSRPTIRMNAQGVQSQLTSADAAIARLMIISQELAAEMCRCQSSLGRPLTIPITLHSMMKQINSSTALTDILTETEAQFQQSGRKRLKHEAPSGTELKRRVHTLTERLKREERKLKEHIRKLNDLKIRWDQEYLCEAEFDSWLKRKELDVNRTLKRSIDRHRRRHASCDTAKHASTSLAYTKLADAMDTAHLEVLLAEIQAKEHILHQFHKERAFLEGHKNPESAKELSEFKLRLSSLIIQISEAISARRQLAAQTVEAAHLTDQLHEDLHRVVHRSNALKPTNSWMNTGPGYMERDRDHLQAVSSDDLKTAHGRPMFWASSSNITEYQSMQIPTPQEFRPSISPYDQWTSILTSSSPSFGFERRLPVADSLEWLWYSPTTVLGLSSEALTDTTARETILERGHQPHLSRASSLSSLPTSGPWTSYRSLQKSTRKLRPTWKDYTETMPVNERSAHPVSTSFPLKIETDLPGSHYRPFDQRKFASAPSKHGFKSSYLQPFQPGTRAPTSPLEAHSTCVADYQHLPMLLRRNISPVPVKTAKRTHRTTEPWPKEQCYWFTVSRHNDYSKQSTVSSSPVSSEFTRFASRFPQAEFIPTDANHFQQQMGSSHTPFQTSLPINRPSAPKKTTSRATLVPSDMDTTICTTRPQPMGASKSESVVSYTVKPRILLRAQSTPVATCFDSGSGFSISTSNLSVSRDTLIAPVPPPLPPNESGGISNMDAGAQLRHRLNTPVQMALQQYRCSGRHEMDYASS